MAKRFTHIKNTLNNWLITHNIVDEHEKAAVNAALITVEEYLSTRHGLFLRQIISSLVSSICAAVFQRPLGAAAGYLGSIYIFATFLHSKMLGDFLFLKCCIPHIAAND